MPELRLLACLLGFAALAPAHEFFSTKLTWSREISRIVFKSCVGCHRDGGSAFSLVTFEQARPWATAIKEEVLGRRMPPWGAAKGFGAFEHDRGLSQDEISLIADWVEGGAPEGQKSYLPKLPSQNSAGGKTLRWREQPLPLGIPTQSSMTIAGVAPRGAIPSGSQVTAELPDGSIEPILWVVDAPAAVKREFLFREPRVFPKGTRFAVSKPGGNWKMLLSGPSSR